AAQRLDCHGISIQRDSPGRGLISCWTWSNRSASAWLAQASWLAGFPCVGAVARSPGSASQPTAITPRNKARIVSLLNGDWNIARLLLCCEPNGSNSASGPSMPRECLIIRKGTHDVTLSLGLVLSEC